MPAHSLKSDVKLDFYQRFSILHLRDQIITHIHMNKTLNLCEKGTIALLRHSGSHPSSQHFTMCEVLALWGNSCLCGIYWLQWECSSSSLFSTMVIICFYRAIGTLKCDLLKAAYRSLCCNMKGQESVSRAIKPVKSGV